MNDSRTHGDTEEPSETSPLIPTRVHFPPVDTEVAFLKASALQGTLHHQVQQHHLGASIDRAYRAIVLLRLKALLTSSTRSRDAETPLPTVTDIQRDVTTVDSALVRIWGFLDSASEVEQVLLEAFPLDKGGIKKIRLLDVLSHAVLPQDLLDHPALVSSLTKIWKRGYRANGAGTREARSVLQALDKHSSPRVLHMLELIAFITYIASLLHFCLYPPMTPFEPTRSSPAVTFREGIIMVFSLAQLCKSWEATVLPYILTLLSFLSCLPASPTPQDGVYSILLFAVSLHLLQLHLPYSPSPLFLVSFERALPLATLIQHGIFRIFIPIILFFLPAFFLTLFLLSASLSSLSLSHTSVPITDAPSPMEVRAAFLALSLVLLILLLCSMAMLVLAYPRFSSQPLPLPDQWDRYSRAVGWEARRAVVSIAAKYSRLSYFPAPLNLIQVLLVWIPRCVVCSVGRKDWLSRVEGVERCIQTLVVGPLGWLASALYLWGIL